MVKPETKPGGYFSNSAFKKRRKNSTLPSITHTSLHRTNTWNIYGKENLSFPSNSSRSLGIGKQWIPSSSFFFMDGEENRRPLVELFPYWNSCNRPVACRLSPVGEVLERKKKKNLGGGWDLSQGMGPPLLCLRRLFYIDA